jgi:DEAD/DEAH box helicase domain-containing protein
MSKVLAIDIETGNSAADIGGWNNTHMWNITCVTTWDGKESKAYVDKPMEIEGVIVKSLRTLKHDLDDHFDSGGILLGHNINSFDLPALRDSMDIYIAKKFLDNKETRCIDTSRLMNKHSSGFHVSLDNLAKCNLGTQKTADGLTAVKWWSEGRYEDVVKYCVMDSKISYEVWEKGRIEKQIEYFNEDKNEFCKIDIEW